MAVIQNRKGSDAVIHAVANTTVALSALAVDGDETVNSAYITQVAWGAEAPGYWRVARGGNTVMILDSTSYIDFAGNGMGLVPDRTGNFTITLNGTANGFITMGVQKESTIANTAYPGGE